jgi:antitoxin component YwqK of YwqJK toxin-antitoxin module
MNTRLLIFVVLCSCLRVYAQELPVAASFHGTIRSVEEHSYKAKSRHHTIRNGRPQREYSGERDFRLDFDSTGRRRQRTVYTRSGEVERVISYTYDSSSFPAKDLRRYDPSGKTDSTLYRNSYYPDGKIQRREVHRSAKRHELTYEHDTSGTIYEYYRNAADASAVPRQSCVYNRNWKPQTTWIYNRKGACIMQAHFEYDTAARLVRKRICNASGVAIHEYRWKYGDKGEVIRYESCNPRGSTCEAWTYKYEFDRTGNWTRRIEYRNGKPVYVKERTLIYY